MSVVEFRVRKAVAERIQRIDGGHVAIGLTVGDIVVGYWRHLSNKMQMKAVVFTIELLKITHIHTHTHLTALC